MTDHVSFDIETLGNKTNALITAIGAARFDIETGEIKETFYCKVDVQKELDAGAKITGDTLAWWIGQDQAVLNESLEGPMNPAWVVHALLAFLDDQPVAGYWGNGSTFDITFLTQFAERHSGVMPWERDDDGQFRLIRDMRTRLDIAEQLSFDRSMVEFEGDAHNALHDAVHQAKVISAATQYIKEGWNV